MLIDFAQLPPDARVWIFAADRPLTEGEQDRLLSAVDTFLQSWKAHGEPLAASRELRYGQFLFVAVDESAAGASGCSIDAMVRVLSELERQLGLTLSDHGPVLYLAGNRVNRVPRHEFARLAREGAVGLDTIVFDNTLTRLADVRAGRWELPARDSWHARAFLSKPVAARS
jgi:hypothetical protein